MQYLYNRVVLPDINEIWTDKETYPYATIYQVSNNIFSLYLSDNIDFEFNDNECRLVIKNAQTYRILPGEFTWKYEGTTMDAGGSFYIVMWTNFDILNEDGSVFLDASEISPVSSVLMPVSDYKAACDAIRAKTGKTNSIKSGEMAAEIGEIEGSGSSTVRSKDVNFYDYDGTLLHSYTVAEAQALSALPSLPTQNGLVCQGWNYDLDTIKSYNRAVDVGATYITDDGKTRLYIKIAAEGRMDVPLYFSQTVSNGVMIDWGDGSATETLSGAGSVNTVHTYASIGEYVISLDVGDGCTIGLGKGSDSHCVLGSASNNGRVYCNMLQKVEVGNSVTSIRGYAFQYCYSLASIIMPYGVTSVESTAFKGCYSLTSIIIPDSITSIGKYAFSGCYTLASIIMPHSVTNIGGNAFSSCYSLASITIPDGVTSIGSYAFSGCYSLASITIPDGVTIIDSYAFSSCYSLVNITIPDGVTSIGSNTFSGCYGMKFYDFTSHTVVPTLENTNAFGNIPSDCEIRVPAALHDEWIAATNWSTYASKIVAV